MSRPGATHRLPAGQDCYIPILLLVYTKGGPNEPDDAYGIHSHGDLGGDWVAERFSPAVSEPVRMHVEAKRYLCATEADYHDRLSGASQYTLTKQGGPMTADEAARFAGRHYAADAVRLRRYEDGDGKRAGVEMPELSHFRSLLEHLQVWSGRS